MGLLCSIMRDWACLLPGIMRRGARSHPPLPLPLSRTQGYPNPNPNPNPFPYPYPQPPRRARRSTSSMVHDPLTLVVALDSVGSAAGELYVDDGRSFAFQRGAYAYRRLEFAGGVLSIGAANASDMGLPPSEYDTAVLIDRVVVLGLAGGPEGWQVSVSSKAGAVRRLDAAAGPLYVRAELPDVALVVRKAGLPVGYDWKLTFTSSGAGKERQQVVGSSGDGSGDSRRSSNRWSWS